MGYTVGAVSRMAGITVRTLHHYHEIGLLAPSDRSPAGYRLYNEDDISRLQEVLFHRELGLGLDEVAELMTRPEYERTRALLEHRRLLEEKRQRLHRLIRAVDRTLDAETKGIPMDANDKLEVFGDFKPEDHEEEVKERWGDSPAFAESARRTARYRKEDWVRIKSEAAANVDRFAQLRAEGKQPDSNDAMDAAEEHRAHISRWFYDCPPRMHVGLAAMYTEDPRFREHYDQHGPGLADFVREAIEANADRS